MLTVFRGLQVTWSSRCSTPSYDARKRASSPFNVTRPKTGGEGRVGAYLLSGDRLKSALVHGRNQSPLVGGKRSEKSLQPILHSPKSSFKSMGSDNLHIQFKKGDIYMSPSASPRSSLGKMVTELSFASMPTSMRPVDEVSERTRKTPNKMNRRGSAVEWASANDVAAKLPPIMLRRDLDMGNVAQRKSSVEEPRSQKMMGFGVSMVRRGSTQY